MRLLYFLLLAVPWLSAQDWRSRNIIMAGAGAGRPRGDIAGFLGDSPEFSVAYAYRFHPNFQAEAGLDTVFGAAGVHDFLDTGFGFQRIRDFQYLVPFGGRAVLPLVHGRAELTGGGGGAYLGYAERLHQPSPYIRFDCPVCNSRGGWGYYGLVNLSTALDRYRHFWFGVTTKMYRGHTEGDALGSLPGIRTRDRWLMLLGEFSFRF